jgi:hypothetical protein
MSENVDISFSLASISVSLALSSLQGSIMPLPPQLRLLCRC